MALHFLTDVSAADWWVRGPTPWEQLVTFGPAGFDAYARLRFVPDPEWPGQAASSWDLPDDHPSDVAQALTALAVLSEFTTTPDDCYFAVWDGRSDTVFPPAVRRGPMIDVPVGRPHRQFFLAAGSLAELTGWGELIGATGNPPPPSLVWPADRRWCFAVDVDPHWAGIGASRPAIDALLSHPTLDVVPADPTARHPYYYA